MSGHGGEGRCLGPAIIILFHRMLEKIVLLLVPMIVTLRHCRILGISWRFGQIQRAVHRPRQGPQGFSQAPRVEILFEVQDEAQKTDLGTATGDFIFIGVCSVGVLRAKLTQVDQVCGPEEAYRNISDKLGRRVGQAGKAWPRGTQIMRQSFHSSAPGTANEIDGGWLLLLPLQQRDADCASALAFAQGLKRVLTPWLHVHTIDAENDVSLFYPALVSRPPSQDFSDNGLAPCRRGSSARAPRVSNSDEEAHVSDCRMPHFLKLFLTGALCSATGGICCHGEPQGGSQRLLHTGKKPRRLVSFGTRCRTNVLIRG
jgi:hypothetical protein